MNRSELLKAAEKIVTTDRNVTYGPPENSLGLIAKFWSAYLGYEVKDYEVGILLGLMKIARIRHNPLHEDSFCDSVGYLAIANELAQPAPVEEPLSGESQWKALHIGDTLQEGDERDMDIGWMEIPKSWVTEKVTFNNTFRRPIKPLSTEPAYQAVHIG
jgi:hypothetical protein